MPCNFKLFFKCLIIFNSNGARLPYRYCSKNVRSVAPDLLLLIQQKLRVVQYRYGSLSAAANTSLQPGFCKMTHSNISMTVNAIDHVVRDGSNQHRRAASSRRSGDPAVSTSKQRCVQHIVIVATSQENSADRAIQLQPIRQLNTGAISACSSLHEKTSSDSDTRRSECRNIDAVCYRTTMYTPAASPFSYVDRK